MLPKSSNDKNINFRQGAGPLFAASFLFSGAHNGVFTLALPFVIVLIGGSDKDLGLCYGLGTIAYVISCLTAGRHLDRFNPKRLLQVSSALITLAMVAVTLVTHLAANDSLSLFPIIMVTVFNAILSLLLTLYWPPMMGWLSRGHEGPALSRRMSRFNLCWSSAQAICPFAAGFILRHSPILAVLTAAVLSAIAFLCVSIAASPRIASGSKKQTSPRLPEPATMLHPSNAAFCTMTRSALFVSCVVLGLMRTQFALLFTDTLGYSKALFGILTGLLCLSAVAGFFVTGKTHRWHHRLLPFAAAQVITAVGLILILGCRSLTALCIAMVLIGVGQSFIYASHQYYAVSGQKDRSKPMAVHEILISAGYACGAIGGGYLAEYFNRFTPYQFALAAVSAALLAQAVIFGLYKKSAARRSA